MNSPATLPDLIAEMRRRIGDLERRMRNITRTGTITAVDRGAQRYRVELKPAGAGQPALLTPWIPARTLAAGAIRATVAHHVGEQVVVASASGDLDDAEIAAALASDANTTPEVADRELILEVGSTRLTVTNDRVRIQAETLEVDAATMTLTASDAATLTAPVITLDGETHLGGSGGEPVHLKGQRDDAGDEAVEGASRVYAR